MADETPPSLTVTDSLSLALVSISDAPLLLLDGELRVIAASKSFCRAFRIEPASTSGSLLFELGGGEWNLPRLRSLLTATASGTASVEAYELDLRDKDGDCRRIVVRAEKVEYAKLGATRVLMTLADVTDARHAVQVKDQLLREKAILLQEVQHRVANSLQIIASVLMQSARTVSDETRSHLSDASNRVMSIATVQKQLSTSGPDKVELKAYFTQLCQSLGASMIRDHDKQTIEVSGDASTVNAEISVSLGLIVTELVINCLKHAFPDERDGRIWVDFQTEGPNWTLSVSDNGVGMPPASAPAQPGLGSSIVDALAKQLHARVTVSDHRPGTTVTVIHSHLSLVEKPPVEIAV